jgi:hypothetical protein
MARHLGMRVKKKERCTLQQLLFLRIRAKDIPDCLEEQYCGYVRLAFHCIMCRTGKYHSVMLIEGYKLQ